MNHFYGVRKENYKLIRKKQGVSLLFVYQKSLKAYNIEPIVI